MNQQQIKYAQQRAKEILDAKRSEIIKKTTTEQVRLSHPQIIEALQTGNFSIKDKGSSHYLRDVIVFTQEINSYVDIQRRDELFREVSAAYNRLMDELILGDNEQALKMLQDFEAVG